MIVDRSTRRVLAVMDASRGRTVLAILLGAGAYLSALGLLAVSAWLISRASQQPPVLSLGVAAVTVRALAISRSILRYSERLVGHDAAFRGLTRLRVALYDRLVDAGPARTALRSRGDLLQRMVGDVDGVQDLVLRVALPWAQALVASTVAVIIAWWLLPAAGIAMLVGLALATTLVPWAGLRAARGADRRSAAARGRVGDAVQSVLDAAPDLRSTGTAQHAVRRVRDLDDEALALDIASAGGRSLAAGAGALVQGLVLVAAAAAGVAATASGRLDGVLLAVVVLLPLAAFESTTALPAAAASLLRVAGSASRIDEVLQSPVDPRDTSPGRDDAVASDDVMPNDDAVQNAPVLRLSALDVRWPEAGADALHGIDLSFVPGRRYAVVGPSGSGKSTLAATLVAFLHPSSGTYTVGEASADGLGGDRVRRTVGLLTQRAHVFDTTLAENLRIARPEADDALLRATLARVGLEAWVRGLPHGLAEPLGHGGRTMSGGQRQRLGLARLLLAERAWWVLDEPTEALDASTASALLDDVMESVGSAGMIMITHRVRDAWRCDEVVVLRDGRVAAVGTPDEVRARDAWFDAAVRYEDEAAAVARAVGALPVGRLTSLA